KGGLALGRSGAWLKDRQLTAEGERSYSVNVGSATGDGALHEIRIFEFDNSGRLVQRIAATSGQVDERSVWTLSNVTLTRWSDAPGTDLATATERKLSQLVWHSTLSAGVVAAAVLPLSTMSTVELSRYISHL